MWDPHRHSQSSHSQPSHPRPNVLTIIMDDLAWGDLACHGNPYARTPNLDRLFGQSTRLTRYHSFPVCTPARAALMTGRYPQRTRAIDTYCGRSMMDPEEYTLAEMLRDAGYTTCISGKWHLGDCHPMRAIDQGFDEALVHNGGGLCQPANFGRDDYFDPDLLHNGQLERREGYCTDIFTDHALRFIEQHRDQPFFCYLATNAPHSPLLIGEQWAQHYRDLGLPDAWARLYGMVENIDQNVGRVMDALDRLEIADDTLVIFTSDHGPCPSARDEQGRDRWNAHLRARKGTPYEGGLRVPFFVRWPRRVRAGRDLDRIANPIDVMPTLASVCGARGPEDRAIDGKDLSPLLLERTQPSDWPERQLFVQWHRGDRPQRYRNFAVIEQRWKLVGARLGPEPGSDPDELKDTAKLENVNALLELYDLEADPGEQHDLSETRPEIVERLREAYDAWFDEVGSTRGEHTYEPPPIHLGTVYENPTVLTRQDWRMYGAKDGWKNGPPGYWLVRVAQPGTYTIRIRLPSDHGGGTLRLNCGGQSRREPVQPGQEQVAFNDLALAAGSGRLEALLEADGREAVGARFVDVRRADTPLGG